MNIPPMYYVNVSFTWILFIISIAGYFYVSRKQGEKWVFWPISAVAWAMFGISHAMLIAGISTNEWYITLLRVLGYLLMVSALSMLMARRKCK